MLPFNLGLTIFLCKLMQYVLLHPDTVPSRWHKSQKVAISLGASFGCLAVFILSIGLVLWWQKKHNSLVFFYVNGLFNISETNIVVVFVSPKETYLKV